MNKLKELRLKYKLKQQEVGDAVGKTKVYICEIEHNKRNLRTISAEMLIKFAKFFGVTAEDLVDVTIDVTAEDLVKERSEKDG